MSLKSSLFADSSYPPLASFGLLDVPIEDWLSLAGVVQREVCAGIQMRPPKTYQYGGLGQKAKRETESSSV